jgi:hypothetical protein
VRKRVAISIFVLFSWISCGTLSRGLSIANGIADTKEIIKDLSFKECLEDRRMDRGFNNMMFLLGPLSLIAMLAITNFGEDGFHLSEDDCAWATGP